MRAPQRYKTAKQLLNGLYTWALHFPHVLLSLLSSFLRPWLPSLCLRQRGRVVLVDHPMYFKYPCLSGIGHDLTLNRGGELPPGLLANGRIRVASGIRIASNVCVLADWHYPHCSKLAEAAGGIAIKDGVWFGAACLRLPGVRIGKRAVVAAGLVVSTNVPAGTIVAAVPARVVRMRKVAA